MSLRDALTSAEEAGTINKCKLRELKDNCCPACEVEVYDFDEYADAYAKEKCIGSCPSCDGVKAAQSQGQERAVLVEMKSIEDIRKELHFNRRLLKDKDRKDSPEKTAAANMEAFERLLEQKFREWDFTGKFEQTNVLLESLKAGFRQSLKDGDCKETALYIYGDDIKFFQAFKHTIEAALKKASSPEWGTPKVIACSLLDELTK